MTRLIAWMLVAAAVSLGGIMPAFAMTIAGVDLPRADLQRIYGDDLNRVDLPLYWTDGRRPYGRAVALLNLLDRAGEHGLSPDDYAADAIRARLTNLSDGNARQTELLLTGVALNYIRDLDGGRAMPDSLMEWSARRPDLADPLHALVEALNTRSVGRLEQRFTPRHPQYRALQQALERYETLAAGGGWPSIPGGPTLRPGERSDRVSAIADRLRFERYMTGTLTDPTLYSGAVVEGVRRFQEVNGLGVDGVIGPATLAALNAPIHRRIDQIRANLERWRWMPSDLGARHVLVNIPEFRLRAVAPNRPTLEMNVVVGRPSRETPVFFSDINDITFNPYWHVPRSIIQRDLLPQFRNDPSAVSRRGFTVISYSTGRAVDPSAVDWTSGSFPYGLRQAPGTSNALGRVRFGIRNDLAIYLHDTPSQSLFNRASRAYSSGCVRVSDPLALLQYVFSDQPGWTPERVQENYDRTASSPSMVHLPNEIPVYLTYFTAWAEPDGRVSFFEDVYGEDGGLVAQMDR